MIDRAEQVRPLGRQERGDINVVLPVWLVALLCLLSTAAVLQFFLLPVVSWHFCRKMNRAIEEVNARVSIEIPAFKRPRRQVRIARLFHAPKAPAAVQHYCETYNMPRTQALRHVYWLACEIVPSFNAHAYCR